MPPLPVTHIRSGCGFSSIRRDHVRRLYSNDHRLHITGDVLHAFIHLLPAAPLGSVACDSASRAMHPRLLVSGQVSYSDGAGAHAGVDCGYLFFVGVVLRPSARLWISEKAGLSTLIVDLEQVTARRRRSSGASSSGPGSSSSEYPLEVGSVKSHHTAKVGGGPHSSGQAEPHSSRSQRSSRSRSPGRKKRE